MPEADIHEQVAAYALDALDDDERAAFEEHLATCDRCAAELPAVRETAAALAYVPESVPPPDALRGRVLETARAERPNVVPLRPRRSHALGAVAAVAVAAAVALAIWNVSLHNSLDNQSSANRSVATYRLQGANGQLAVASSGQAALFLCGIGTAPAGKTYEAWVLTGKQAARAGEFQGGSGCTAVVLARPVPAGSGVAVTVEPAGGSEQPTSTPIIQSLPA